MVLSLILGASLTLSFPFRVPSSPRLRVPASSRLRIPASPRQLVNATSRPEYLWYEAENMRGFATDSRGEPVLNPSWRNLPKSQAPGWGINGPGVSAEWSQGGESEWNSAAASADETKATIYQDIEVPRAGEYKVWVRYADWAGRTEYFTVRISQRMDAEARRHGDTEISASPRLGVTASRFSASPRHPVPLSQFIASARPSVAASDSLEHEFGTSDVIDPHDEVGMYWGWVFAWDSFQSKLQKGSARISIEVDKPAGARRHVDCLLVTNDLTYVPQGRAKPDFAGMRYLREWNQKRAPLTSLIQAPTLEVPQAWLRPKLAGRDFLMPWNIAKEFWQLYEQPETERPLYPFHAEPIEQFVEKYKGVRDVPIFSSKLVIPVIYLPQLPEYLKEGSPFLRYLRETKVPFAVLINYGAAQFSEPDGAAAWKLLTGELRDQFLGWISGESVGYVWDSAAADLKVSSHMSRRELLEKYRMFYTNALDRKWRSTFQRQTGPMWDKLIPAQSTSSTSYAHALTNWGVRLLGMETAAVQPMFAMRIAFTRGAARQFGGAFLYYHAPNFGDTATTFTNQQNFAGPNNFFHSRYGATMGPSLSWYRKSYYLYYMGGASAIYLEQGFDQFFKPGPGEHDFQLNPLGRITDEFMRFVERHPNRGTPYTPVAFLLDPAHGWDMTDYPQWPFGVSQINRSDRALRELFGVAYYPGLVMEGEPATGDRQAFVNGVFGDIFDVIVASEEVQSPKSKVQSRNQVPSSEFRVPSLRFRPVSPSPRPPVSPSSRRPVAPSPRLPVAPSPRLPVDPFPRLPVSLSLHSSVSPTLRLPVSASPLTPYRAVVIGGHIDWTPVTTGSGSDRVQLSDWPQRLADYVRNGGTVVLNAAQAKGLPEELTGVQLLSETAEADRANCVLDRDHDLSGQLFRYVRVRLKGASTLIASPNSDPLVTVNKLGKGTVIFNAVPDLLGVDERMTPFSVHMLAHVFSNAAPVRVEGHVEYLINRTDASWVITIFNNKGVYKPQQGLAQVNRSETATATITIPGKPINAATEWLSDKPLAVQRTRPADDKITVIIPPGGISIVELK